MDPKPPPEYTPVSPLPENQENEYKEHALVDHKGIENAHCDAEDTKESKTWEIFKTKVLEFARESRMSPEHILLIERSLPDLFPDLHVPDHPPYAAMIRKAITELDEAGGSTEEAISLFIRKEQNDLPWAHATLLKHHLEKLCQSGDIVVTGEKCYMLNTTCETYNTNHTNQIEAFDTNPIETFDTNQISVSRIPSFSPYSSPSSGSSSSYSDYTPYANERKQKMTGRKYGKKRCGKKAESKEEFEEHSAESGKHTHRTEGAKKNKTEDESEGTKIVRARGRPLKYSKPKTNKGPKEAQVGLIETHNQVSEIPRGLKQKRGRGRPPKNNGVETKTRPKETQEQLWEIHNQLRGRERCSPTKKIGNDTDIGPKEVRNEVMSTFNQATKDLNRPREKRGRGRPPKNMGNDINIVQKDLNRPREKRPREKRGRGRPPKNMGNDINIVQKEAQGVIDAHNQMDCMEKPKQKRGRGRPPKNSGGEMVVFELQNQTAEDGMNLKQGRRQFRHQHEREEVNKYLDQVELTVIQEMFEKMKI